MAVAADQKKPQQNLGQHPRAARQKPKAAALDDPEAHLRITDEKFRQQLWNDFARFVRSHGGVVISRPSHSPVRVLVPLGETSALEIALRSLSKYPRDLKQEPPSVLVRSACSTALKRR